MIKKTSGDDTCIYEINIKKDAAVIENIEKYFLRSTGCKNSKGIKIEEIESKEEPENGDKIENEKSKILVTIMDKEIDLAVIDEKIGFKG